MSTAVEGREDAIPRELLHLAAEPTADERRGHRVVGPQHRGDLDRVAGVGEAGEPLEVTDEHGNLLPMLPRGREVQLVEPVLAPLPLRSTEHQEIAGYDEAVPHPPRGM